MALAPSIRLLPGRSIEFADGYARDYRIIRLYYGRITVLEVGQTILSDDVLKGWKPGCFRTGWNKQTNFGLAFEVQLPDGSWNRLREYPHRG